jgi:hypothetical protein
MRSRIIAALLLGLAVAAPGRSAAAADAAARVDDGVTAAELAALLETYPEIEGVEIHDGRYGNPALSATASGIRFDVFLFHCDDTAEARCGEVQYKATFVPAAGRATEAAAAVKRWDQDWVFGRAFVEDDDDVVIEHAHFATGVTPDYLHENADLWLLSILPDFRKTIGY